MTGTVRSAADGSGLATARHQTSKQDSTAPMRRFVLPHRTTNA
jgi:hypothetical protein